MNKHLKTRVAKLERIVAELSSEARHDQRVLEQHDVELDSIRRD